MKKILLVLSALGMSIAQTSGAAEVTFQPNNTLNHTITTVSAANHYGSTRNVYSSNSGAYVSSNEEISRAIDNLSAHAKQKQYQLAGRAVPVSDTLSDMKKWAEQGNVDYQIEVGRVYYEGEGVRQDLVLSRRMIQKAANKGDARGQAMLAFFYENGLGGLRQNRAAAKELYGKTCDQGYQVGCDEYRRLNQRGY